MREFDWRRFRSETPPDLYDFLRENYWKKMDKWEFNWKANEFLPVPDCYPKSIQRYGEDWFKFYAWMQREYGWFDGRTPRQRYNQRHKVL